MKLNTLLAKKLTARQQAGYINQAELMRMFDVTIHQARTLFKPRHSYGKKKYYHEKDLPEYRRIIAALRNEAE